MAQIKTKIILRNDVTANWELNNPVLSKGEAGLEFLETGEVKIKIGDGVKAWKELEYFGGTEVFGDDKSVQVVDGVVSLVGFEAAEVGAQPRKNADGTIEWVVPSTDTVDGLQATVAGLQSDVTNLQENVTIIQEIVNPSGEDAVPLLTRVETLEEKMDGDGEGSVNARIDAKINEFATNITDDGVVNSYKELIDYVATHGGEAADMAADILSLQELVGSTPVSDQIVEAINGAGHIAKEEAKVVFEKVEYEISSKPVGTLVNMKDKEIRVMCPEDTAWALQNSGTNSDANMYYIGFKAYAPEGAVSFKEDLAEIIADQTMYYFEGNDFAGVDEFGRKYSIVWLPVANYDGANWTYYGVNSSAERFIGWYYSVEWYNADGLKLHADTIRINLTNEDCHTSVQEFVNVNNLVQTDGDVLVLDGGSSAL